MEIFEEACVPREPVKDSADNEMHDEPELASTCACRNAARCAFACH